jgi:ribosomal protein S18 acetylase RimI-like enzyme
VLVERAGQSDLERLVATLVESHLDYAWEVWAVIGGDRRARLDAAFRSDLQLLGLPHGVVMKTSDYEAVAVWLPVWAGELLTADERRRRDDLASRIFGDRLAIVEEADDLVGSTPCPAADWHLATMGTLPALQRQGLGSAVLGPMLEQLDRDGHSARLETSTAGNVAFYERHGFEVVTELDLPHGAPTTWSMHRRPGDAR